jgi:hypothetical protein
MVEEREWIFALSDARAKGEARAVQTLMARSGDVAPPTA